MPQDACDKQGMWFTGHVCNIQDHSALLYRIMVHKKWDKLDIRQKARLVIWDIKA